MELDVLLVQGSFYTVECGPFLGERRADILIYPYNCVLIFQLMVSGPAQGSLFLLEFGETDQKRAGEFPVAGPDGRGPCALSSSGGAGKTSGPVTCINNSDMNLTGSLPSSLPSGMFQGHPACPEETGFGFEAQ